MTNFKISQNVDLFSFSFFFDIYYIIYYLIIKIDFMNLGFYELFSIHLFKYNILELLTFWSFEQHMSLHCLTTKRSILIFI